jgi:hypothetical protein
MAGRRPHRKHETPATSRTGCGSEHCQRRGGRLAFVHIVAGRLGDDPKTVLSTYAHLLPQSDEIAAERVAAMLD